MENLYKITRKKLKEKGMALVVVMLFLSIISFIASSLLNTSLLEIKMSNYYNNKAHAFYMAENILEKYEQEILNNEITSPEITEIRDANVCGAFFYKIIATAKYNHVVSMLQSSFAKIIPTDSCAKIPNIKPGRQSFLVIN